MTPARLARAPLGRSLTILGALLVVSEVAAAGGRWSSTGPTCSDSPAIAFAGAGSRRVYAGVYAGSTDYVVFQSFDNGRKWSELPRQPETNVLYEIEVHPRDERTLFLVTRAGIFRSVDEGRRWKLLRRDLPPYYRALDLEIHPVDPRRMYLMAELQRGLWRLYRSDDAGQSWRDVSPFTAMISFSVHPRDPDLLWLVARDGILRSTDGGEAWAEASDGLVHAAHPLSIDPSAPQTLYTTDGVTVYRTLDGRRWRPLGRLPDGWTIYGVQVDPSAPSRLFLTAGKAGEDGGLWRSVDGGRSWKRAPIGPVSEIAFHPNGRILIATNALGPHRSVDGGRTWSRHATGMNTSQIDSLDALPALARSSKRPIVYAGRGCGGLEIRKEGAEEWVLRRRPFDVRADSIAVSPADPRHVHAAGRLGDSLISASVSTDAGQSWLVKELPGKAVLGLEASLADPRRVYLLVDGEGLYRSVDAGLEWTLIPAAQLALHVGDFGTVAPHPSDADTVFVAGAGGMVRSDDGGDSWRRVADFEIVRLAIDPRRPQTMFTAGRGAVRRSRNGGETWKTVWEQPGTYFHWVLVDGFRDGHVYVTTFDEVFRSVDGGRRWKRFQRGLKGVRESQDRGYFLRQTAAGELLLATGRGVYSLPAP